jgi:hypothetical protein
VKSPSPRAPQNYAEWLALAPEGKEQIKRYVWNAYKWDGRCFAMMAAARLMMEDRRIQDISVGVYHCGEYILNPTVSNLDFMTCPRWLEQVYEGFRVGWLKESYEFNPDDARRLEGTWICEEDRCDAVFHIQVGENGISVTGHRASTSERLFVKFCGFDGNHLSFEARLARDGFGTLHTFSPCEPEQGRSRPPEDLNRCENVMRVPTFWKRKPDANGRRIQ